jgi:hypothetical protein
MHSRRVLKKYILKLKYLEEEHEECMEIHEKSHHEFEKIIRQLHSNLNVFDQALDSPFQENKKYKDEVDQDRVEADITDESLKKNNQPKWAKKIFRKIAMVTHPDKIPKDLDEAMSKRLIGMYQKAKDSIGQSEYADLIMIASDLDIDLQKIEIDNLNFFKKKEEDLKNKIKKIKSSVFWIWAHSSDDQKDKIVQEFIRSRGWTSSESLRKRSRSGVGKNPGKSLSWARNSKIDRKK